MVYFMENSLKWMIWGYPYFWKHSIIHDIFFKTEVFCFYCAQNYATFLSTFKLEHFMNLEYDVTLNFATFLSQVLPSDLFMGFK